MTSHNSKCTLSALDERLRSKLNIKSDTDVSQITPENLGLHRVTQSPKLIEYAHINKRIETFSACEACDSSQVKQLAASGFYKQADNSRIECFYCRLNLAVADYSSLCIDKIHENKSCLYFELYLRSKNGDSVKLDHDLNHGVKKACRLCKKEASCQWMLFCSCTGCPLCYFCFDCFPSCFILSPHHSDSLHCPKCKGCIVFLNFKPDKTF